jgi:hypothetical protein
MAKVHARGAASVTSASPARKRSNPLAILVRVVVMTAAFGVLGLGLGGLMGIVAVSVMNLTGLHVDMDMALFAGGMPGAVIGLVGGLVVMVHSERKQLRRFKD